MMMRKMVEGLNSIACVPVDGSDNLLVDLGATFEVWIMGVGRRDGIDGVP